MALNPLVLQPVSAAANALAVKLTSIQISRSSRSAERLVRCHVDELEGLGQRIPPLSREIRTLGGICGSEAAMAAGEVGALADGCVLLLQHAGRIWIGVGVHHPMEVAQPPVNCAEPRGANRVGSSWWAYEDVADHWNLLKLRLCSGSQGAGWDRAEVSILEEGNRPEQMLRDCHPSGSLSEAALLFFSMAVTPLRVRSGSHVRCELLDDALGREIRLDYRHG
jgi:hypothetical protein